MIRLLDPRPDEIAVTADGCTDSTIQVVRELLPEATLFINEQGQGSVASRDAMLRAASADLMLSLDDDSYPLERDCLALLRDLFAAIPALAVAHFPQKTDEYPETLSGTDSGPPRLTGSYPNSGACYRRCLYLQLAGFEKRFFHAYEEPDYALQCVAAGKHVLLYPGITVRHHFSSVARSRNRTHLRHARNELWSAVMRCPFPLVAIVIPYRILSQARYALSQGIDWVVREPIWWWEAARGLGAAIRGRRPVPLRAYYRWLRLLRQPEAFVVERIERP